MEAVLLNHKAIYFSTELLSDIFKNYQYPKDKIKNLVKKNELIKVTKGLYLLGPIYNRTYSNEVLSGIIYGPSAISFSYALSYHGMIPERVETITALTSKKDNNFNTNIGVFSYKYFPDSKISIGLNYIQSELGNFFIAGPEKAICDMAYFEKKISKDTAIEYLIDDLRISEKSLLRLDLELCLKIEELYRKQSVTDLVKAIITFQSKKGKE